MVFTNAGKQRMLEILYGDEATDTITDFKIGDGTTPFSSASTDLTSPIEIGGGELVDFTSHTYTSGTATMEAQCDISTTDYTGNCSEFGIFTASGTSIFLETFPTYYKDNSTNLRILAKFTML